MQNKLNLVDKHNNENFEEAPRENMMTWDAPFCYRNKEFFIPAVFFADGKTVSEISSFNSEIIILDAHVKSSLDWSEAYAKADKVIKEGRCVLWFLDFGLFDALPFSLHNNSQYLTLSLAIEHFNKETWSRYKTSSLGVVIYKGDFNVCHLVGSDVDSLSNFREWLGGSHLEDVTPETLKTSVAGKKTLQKYACDIATDYLDLLAQDLNEDVECFALVDAEKIEDPILALQAFAGGRNSRFRFVLKNCVLPPQDIAWDSPSPFGVVGTKVFEMNQYRDKYPVGVSVPAFPGAVDCCFQDAVKELIKQGVAFRQIPEELLTTAWDGLDYLVISSSKVSSLGLRMLQGFVAAGGTVVTVGPLLGLSNELSFSDFLKKS